MDSVSSSNISNYVRQPNSLVAIVKSVVVVGCHYIIITKLTSHKHLCFHVLLATII